MSVISLNDGLKKKKHKKTITKKEKTPKREGEAEKFRD